MPDDQNRHDFQNGFNYCIEKVLNEINIIALQKYSLDISTGEVLFRLKEKILSMHFSGKSLPSGLFINEQN